MALEDLIAGQGWTNLPPPQFGGGLLDAPEVNRYQQIMAQMQQPQQAPMGLLDATGGYRPEIYNITPAQNQAIIKLNNLLSSIPIGGSGTANSNVAAQKAAMDAAIAQMTPGEVAQMNAMAIPNLVNLVLPFPIKVVLDALGMTPGTTSSGGIGKTGSPMKGIASKGNVGQVANALAIVNAAINAGGRGSGPSGATGNVGIGMGATSTGLGTGIGASVGGIGGGL